METVSVLCHFQILKYNGHNLHCHTSLPVRLESQMLTEYSVALTLKLNAEIMINPGFIDPTV